MKFPTYRTRKLLLLLIVATSVTSQAQDWAKSRLDASSRHHEYASLKSGNRTVQAFVVYPETKGKTPAVILIHEIFGLSDWAKEMSDELAAQGFIVVAPDLLSGLVRMVVDQAGFRTRRPGSKPFPRWIRTGFWPISMPQPIMRSTFPPATARLPRSAFVGEVPNPSRSRPTAKICRRRSSFTVLDLQT
jgi:hypothetical protein